VRFLVIKREVDEIRENYRNGKRVQMCGVHGLTDV
jgi:hypothetical protein